MDEQAPEVHIPYQWLKANIKNLIMGGSLLTLLSGGGAAAWWASAVQSKIDAVSGIPERLIRIEERMQTVQEGIAEIKGSLKELRDEARTRQ